MTHEQAYYHKYMMEIGLYDDFDRALDTMLEQEDPLSEFALDLSVCGKDRNKQLAVLNEYVRKVPPEEINRDLVFSLVAAHFLSMYEQNPDQLEQITGWMSSVAEATEWCADSALWETMSCIRFYFNEAQDGDITKECFMECLTKLLREKTAVNPFFHNAHPRLCRPFIDRSRNLFSHIIHGRKR